MSNFNQQLLWRYATKKFDPSKKLSAQQIDDLLEAVRLAPSSFGLQPYRLLVITNPELRAKIREASWGQPQITDASHLLIFCALTEMGEAYVDAFVENIAETRGVSKESLAGYRSAMVGSAAKRSTEELTSWNQKQAYIGLGVALSAAAHANIDACPMEGFDPAKVDAILDLPSMHLTATVFCAVGFRASDDPAALQHKVRLPRKDFVIERV